MRMRSRLAKLFVPEAAEHCLQDFRRGHARDLVEKGASFAMDFGSSASACASARLFDILKAGEWKSPAFLLYCDMHKLESSAVVEAHLDESDGE